jgi:putative membrane protein
MYFLIKLLVNTLALLLVVRIIPGIHIVDWATALLTAFGLGIVNAVIRPVVIILTLPLNILTLGLLTFVINALLFYSVSAFIPGFTVSGFGAALAGSLLYSLFSSVLSAFVAPGRARFFTYHSDSARKKYSDAIDVEGRSEEHERTEAGE